MCIFMVTRNQHILQQEILISLCLSSFMSSTPFSKASGAHIDGSRDVDFLQNISVFELLGQFRTSAAASLKDLACSNG